MRIPLLTGLLGAFFSIGAAASWAQANATQEFLDENQYSENGILRYERIFGEGFISTGGLQTTEQIVAMLGLEPGQKVLDVGCGIGGSAVYMAANYDVEVVGIDLSVNMIRIAQERFTEYPQVDFRVEDVFTVDFVQESFDVIYSRDAFIHVHDKEGLFQRLFSWLKPGGVLLITDYCRGEDASSKEFFDYVAQRGYHLLTAEQYGELIQEAGFIDVSAWDQSELFSAILRRELADVSEMRDAFIADFSEQDYEEIVRGWQAKLVRVANREQTWGWFIARKAE